MSPFRYPTRRRRRARPPADSLDIITYSLAADFERDGFEGVFVVRLLPRSSRVKITHNRGGRCDFRYQLAGTRFVSIIPETERLRLQHTTHADKPVRQTIPKLRLPSDPAGLSVSHATPVAGR